MVEIEIPLTGGNSNASVVRIDNTVRRTIGRSSATVHRLLEFLQKQGFSHAPKFLGIDQKGREILSFIDGTCEISRSVWCSDMAIKSVATSLRDFHDITSRYPAQHDDNWAFVYPDRSQHEVICHNDFGLYNLILNDDQCTGIIDFDLAGPGPRLRDIAYAAYWLTPLSFNAADMAPFTQTDIHNGCRRLKLFCSSYGIAADSDLLSMVSEVLHFMGNENAMVKLQGKEITQSLVRDGHLHHWQKEALTFDENRQLLESAILSD